MVTIDERRRVAEGLRFSVGKNPMTMPQAGRLIISNMCPYGFTSWNDILLNLADLIDPGLAEAKDEVNEVNVDREALLALAEEMERKADDFDATVGDVPMVHAGYLTAYAARIREACGVGA